MVRSTEKVDKYEKEGRGELDGRSHRVQFNSNFCRQNNIAYVRLKCTKLPTRLGQTVTGTLGRVMGVRDNFIQTCVFNCSDTIFISWYYVCYNVCYYVYNSLNFILCSWSRIDGKTQCVCRTVTVATDSFVGSICSERKFRNSPSSAPTSE